MEFQLANSVRNTRPRQLKVLQIKRFEYYVLHFSFIWFISCWMVNKKKTVICMQCKQQNEIRNGHRQERVRERETELGNKCKWCNQKLISNECKCFTTLFCGCCILNLLHSFRLNCNQIGTETEIKKAEPSLAWLLVQRAACLFCVAHTYIEQVSRLCNIQNWNACACLICYTADLLQQWQHRVWRREGE